MTNYKNYSKESIVTLIRTTEKIINFYKIEIEGLKEWDDGEERTNVILKAEKEKNMRSLNYFEKELAKENQKLKEMKKELYFRKRA